MAQAENTELLDTFDQFYRQYCSDEIGDLASKYPGEKRSLYLDWADLYRYDADLADDYLSQPDIIREYAEEALRLYDLPVDVILGQAHVRVFNLPEQTTISNIRSRHVNTLVSVQGTVERASEVRSELIEGAFECQRCGTLTYIPQSRYADKQEPHECQGCERQGPFKENRDQSEYVDAQMVLVKRRPTNVSTEQGASIEARLHDDIAGEVSPGDTVTVTGVVHLLDGDDRTEASIADKFLAASDVTIEEDEFLALDITDDDKREIIERSNQNDIYEQMVASFAPSIYGYEQEKLAIILQLFSGVTKHLPDRTRIRGDLHVGLMGDPGTAKSRLLDYAGVLAPRTVAVSGNNTTSVGLTATTKKTSSGVKTWTFEAGALPMADRGLARIDNLDALKSEHIATLHGVLEDQKVELNKATVSATIKARTAVLAAANPKYGRFDQYESIGEQVDLNPGLISQFDLIFTVTDQPDEHHDEQVAEHILQSNYAGELNSQQTEMAAAPVSDEEVEDAIEDIAPATDPILLRKYIAYARQNCFPTMTDDAMATIKEFYVNLRTKGADEDAPVPVTARKLEGMVRLAEASARVRLSDSVKQADAERAVKLVRSCLRDLGVDPETGQFDADVVEEGTKKRVSDRDEEKALKHKIASIEEDFDEGAPVGEVLKQASDIGISQSKAEHLIDNLKQSGNVYEPSTDHLRTT